MGPGNTSFKVVREKKVSLKESVRESSECSRKGWRVSGSQGDAEFQGASGQQLSNSGC